MIDANRISEIMKDVLYTKEELVGMKPREMWRMFPGGMPYVSINVSDST